MTKKIYLSFNDFSYIDENFKDMIIQKYNSNNMSYEKFINFNPKALIKRYNRGEVSKKGCNTCGSTCCSTYCCVQYKYENVINCYFRNYSIFWFEPDQLSPTEFTDNVNIENVNKNVEFTIYDTKYAIPRLISPFAISFFYKTTGTYNKGGLTLRISIADTRTDSSNITKMSLELSLPKSTTPRYYTVLLPCLTNPVIYTVGVVVNFEFTSDVQLALGTSISSSQRNIYVAALYHIYTPFNVFALRSLAGACAFYRRFILKFTKGVYPSPFIDNTSNLPILEYMFKLMEGISNGVGSSIITQLSQTEFNKEGLDKLKNLLIVYIAELRRYASNVTYLTRGTFDDFIVNNASNGILDIYIDNALDYITNIQNLVNDFKKQQFLRIQDDEYKKQQILLKIEQLNRLNQEQNFNNINA